MNNVAILVGCQHYTDPGLQNLIGVNNDVDLMKETLINYCGCNQDMVFSFTSNDEYVGNPTGSDILSQICATANKFQNTVINTLFFYYSGHGNTQNGVPYLLPSDTIIKLNHGLISVNKLKTALDQFQCVKNIIIFLDICQSESVIKGGTDPNFQDIIPKGVVIFYSCSPYQNSYMLPLNDGGGSIYTKFLVEALSSAKSSCTVEEITNMVRVKLEKYCQEHSISQIPHTELFDPSLKDIILTNNRKTAYAIKEQFDTLDLNKSIWLIDAEKAEGDETRFKTFTETNLVKKFLKHDSEYWGVASVKGIGKTFLLQVRRVKMSRQAHCFPSVKKPSKDNNWATECIKFTDTEASIQAIESYSHIKLLWKYSLLCYILRCWLVKQRKCKASQRNKHYSDISQWIEFEYTNTKFSIWTYKFLTDDSFNKLQLIMEHTLQIEEWHSKIVSQYMTLQRLGHKIIAAISDTSKASLVLFLDKIDQAMRQPNAEQTLDCENCSKRETIQICTNEKKDTSYCTSDKGDTCFQRSLCCYGCENFADVYAGTGLRINDQAVLKKRHYSYWQKLQLALIEAVTDIKSDFNGLIKVVYTVRLEACNFDETIWGDQRAKIMSQTCILDYTRDEQKKIYHECIKYQTGNLLYLPNLASKPGNEDMAFVGVSQICHPYVLGASESIFDIVYRHSFGRTRDIQDYGQALTTRMQDIKANLTEAERGSLVKQIIEETAARLAYNTNKATRSSENSYYFEKMPIMPSYWADPANFEYLMNCIDRNLLFIEDIKKICQAINNVDSCPLRGCPSCPHHPFSALKNLGMLGYVVLSENGLNYSIQHFLAAKDITYFHDEDDLKVNNKTLYLIHPALTKSIEKLRNDKKIMHFSGFLIGRDIQVKQSVLKTILDEKRTLPKIEFEKKYYSFVEPEG